MNKNILLIGGGTLIIGGIAATGILLGGFEKSSGGERLEKEIAEDVEEQNFKDFADKERYSFCQSREEIKGPYTSSVFGNENGNIEYVSDDINIFDKEKNKLFILGRQIKYTYSGKGQTNYDIGEGKIDIQEEGATIEYYSVFNAPIRIDYNAQMIYPAPERKKNDWVVIERKGQGTVMGFTQEDTDIAMGDAKTFCPPFPLKNAFITPEYFSFEKSCANNSSGLGFNFSGNFKFECGGIDNEKGIEILKELKLKEEAMNMLDSSSSFEEGSEENEFKNLIKETPTDDRDIQKKIEEMREDIKASGSTN